MKISRYRSSFVIYGIGIEKSLITAALIKRNYAVQPFASLALALEYVSESPPHIVFLGVNELSVEKVQEQCQVLADLLPEVHIILVTADHSKKQYCDLLEADVFDLVTLGANELEFVKAADRAATCDFYLYQNEQLREQSTAEVVEEESIDVNLSNFHLWLKQVESATSYDLIIELFMTEVSRNLKNAPVIFMKYISGRQSLVVAQSVGVELQQLRGVGFDLRENTNVPPQDQLRQPQNIEGLRQLVERALPEENYSAFSLSIGTEVKGVFALFSEQKDLCEDGQLADPYLKLCLHLASAAIEKQTMHKRLHKVSQFDEATMTYRCDIFEQKISEEISRSRRTSLPVSLLTLSVDNYKGLPKYILDSFDLLLKNIAAVIADNSRVNDFTGRISERDLGVLLPHTHKEGAAIKAERLRRIIASADFSALFKAAPQVTVSIGVSEYPSLCHDTEGLFKAADDALFEVKSSTANKVCLARTPDNFMPDFIVR